MMPPLVPLAGAAAAPGLMSRAAEPAATAQPADAMPASFANLLLALLGAPASAARQPLAVTENAAAEEGGPAHEAAVVHDPYLTTRARSTAYSSDSTLAPRPYDNAPGTRKVTEAAAPANAAEWTAPATATEATAPASAAETTAPATATETTAPVTAAKATAPATATETTAPASALEAAVPTGVMAAGALPAPDASHTHGLDRTFATRLDRVIERMHSEHGHDVRIVEGRRSQERQDALFAQGRTTPGSVVTWTRNSRHTLGAAADVIIDGSYENRAAYRTLERVATEEGLRTLGPRDPGHIELPRSQTASATKQTPPPVEPTAPGHGSVLASPPASGVRTRAAPAVTTNVARVADPSRVAHVTHVARVAQPAPVRNDARVAHVAAGARTARVAPVPNVANAVRGHTAAITAGTAGITQFTGTAPDIPAFAAAGEHLADDHARTAGAGVADPDAAHVQLRPVIAAPVSAHGNAAEPATGVSAGAGAASLDRVAQLLELTESQRAMSPMQHIRIRIPEADGGGTLRIGTRGTELSALIQPADPGAAADLAQHTNELRATLIRRGFDVEAVVVREAMRPAMQTIPETGSTSQGSRNGGQPDHRDRDQHSPAERHGQHADSRRHQQGRRRS